MDGFFAWFGNIILLSIPIGFAWVVIYRIRHIIGLPDWLSGIFAQGIISGHKIRTGIADSEDYGFIIIATVVSGFATTYTTFLLGLSVQNRLQNQ